MYSLSSLTCLRQICHDCWSQVTGLKCIFLKHHMIYKTFYFLPWLRHLGVSSRNTTQGKRVTYTFPSGFQSCSPNPCKQAGTCELSRRGDAYCRWEHFFIEVSIDKLENLMTLLCDGYLLRKHRFDISDTFFPRCYCWSFCVLSMTILVNIIKAGITASLVQTCENPPQTWDLRAMQPERGVVLSRPPV